MDTDANPLLDDSPESWDRLVEALGPASMLLCIQNRLGPKLGASITAEDIWQETLLYVWRDRAKFEWRGYPAFRRWVLTIAENRIRHTAERLSAKKRGGDVPQADATLSSLPPPVSSTTPSRVASFAEESRAMRAALEALPEELREVVRLRLFEELQVAEIATELELGISAVKHRLRRGAALYHETLQRVLTQWSEGRG